MPLTKPLSAGYLAKIIFLGFKNELFVFLKTDNWLSSVKIEIDFFFAYCKDFIGQAVPMDEPRKNGTPPFADPSAPL